MFFENNLSESDNSGYEQEETSAQIALGSGGGSKSVIEQLIEATENERFCPDILPYPSALIDAASTEIATTQRRVAQMAEQEKSDAAAESGASLLPFKGSNIALLEVQRAQFFLTELLRCRIRKIESFCFLIAYEGQLESQEGDGSSVPFPQRAQLSENEKVMADRLAEMMHKCVLRSGLHNLPAELQQLVPSSPYGEGMEILPQPDVDLYVFGVALTDLGVVPLDEGFTQEVSAGEVLLVPYKTFRPFVIAGQVRLI